MFRQFFYALRLKRSGNLVGADASRAYVLSGNGSIFIHFDGLNVSVPFSSCMPVGVGYIVSGNLSLTTNFAFF